MQIGRALKISHITPTVTAFLAAFTLVGCGTYAVKKDLEVSASVMHEARNDAKAQKLFMEAVLTVPMKAIDYCDKKSVRFPFMYGSSAWLKRHMTDEQYSALHKTLGLDEEWRVIHALPLSGLKQGDLIEKIDGSGLGDEFYTPPNLWAGMKQVNSLTTNDENEPKTVAVRVKGKGTIDVPLLRGCGGSVNGFSYARTSLRHTSTGYLQPKSWTVIPQSVVRAIETPDEAAFVVLWGLYGVSSDAADPAVLARVAGGAGLGAGLVAAAATPFGIGLLVAQAAFKIGGENVLNSAFEQTVRYLSPKADEWAMKTMAKLGYDPSAAIRLNERLASAGTNKMFFVMDGERMTAANTLLAQLASTKIIYSEKMVSITNLDEAAIHLDEAAIQPALLTSSREESRK